MTSSMTTGERRWTSARKGGMTVLGKVAVPKPINLPSQRLENQGLDPNVEIVPKGTLSWGSRPSSAASNAWGSSALSPSTDGSSSSPSHLVGRPLSAGGSRPSTAGSERAHDSNSNMWSSNSRPSSSSGVVASNNSSLKSLRPLYAETRPGSSQLSRFAEPTAESSGAWGSNATSERIGVGNCKKDGFSLSSGDFPTLGTDKDESITNVESSDHASDRHPLSPGSRTMSESIGASHGEDMSRNADFGGNSWRNDGSPHVENGPRPSMEKCYAEPYPYHKSHMAPPHFESWRGPLPVNPQGRVWYRGPPGPPPYGAPGAHGSFPIEPFPYYRPLVPAPGLGNSQSIPSPGVGPHGHHSNNGDMYRPHMPEPCVHPGMPIRSGFYRGTVPYEGYYGPPMRFCNPNERDLSFMGMGTAPPVYNRPVNPSAPDSNTSFPRRGEDGVLGQVDPDLPHDTRGSYKFLKKQNDGWNQNDETTLGDKVTTVASNCEKGALSKASQQDNAFGDDYKKDEDMHHGKNSACEEAPSQSLENTPIPGNLKFPGCVDNMEGSAICGGIENATSPGDHSLIQKIGGLNAKARASGLRDDHSHREEAHGRVHIVNARVSQSAIDVNSNVVLERHYPSGVPVPVSYDNHIATENRSNEITDSSVTAGPRKLTRGAQNRGDHQRKVSYKGQEADVWRKNSEFGIVVSTTGSGSNINDQLAVHHPVVDPAKVPASIVEKKGDKESVASTTKPTDTQPAKMRERSKHHAIQQQKDKGEKIQEQKAKSHAKVDELNCRYTVDSVLTDSFASVKQEDSEKNLELLSEANQMSVPSAASANIIAHPSEKGDSNSVDAETKKSSYRDAFMLQSPSPAVDVNFNDATGHRTAPKVCETSKQKQAGHKHRQSNPPEKCSTQDSISGESDVVKDIKDSSVTEKTTGVEVSSGADQELADLHQTSGSSAHQRRKNRAGRNKNKVGEQSKAISLPGSGPKDSNYGEGVAESVDQSASDQNIKSIQLSADASNASQSSETLSSPHEGGHGRQNNSWKSQNSRKPRNSQGHRLPVKAHCNDAIVWAPVRSYDKVEGTDHQPNKKATESSVSSATGENVAVSSSKTKRAEMERYVPKPVAKELAQQGSIQQAPPPLVDQAEVDGTIRRVKTSQRPDHVEKAHSTVDSKHVDGKPRHKSQVSWRQCVSAESTPVRVSQDNIVSADINKNIEKSNRFDQTAKSNESLLGKPPRYDAPLAKGPQIDGSDGWNHVSDSGSTMSAAFPGVDHTHSGKGKKPFKGRKGRSNDQNIDEKNTNFVSTHFEHLPVETSQTEAKVPSKEIRAVVDHVSSHWQLKAQGFVAHNQKGNKYRGGQNFSPEDSKILNEATGDNGKIRPSQNVQDCAGNSVASEHKDLGGAVTSLRHQENKQDKNGPLVRGRPNYSSQGSVGEVESSPVGGTWEHNEQHPSSGYRKNTNYGGRFHKGQESRGDWSLTAEENKQHGSSTNQENPRPNSHHKYHPVGSYNNSSNSLSNDSGTQTSNQLGGQRFHERGQSHSRHGRGNFYGRQRGNRNDASYE